jgi:hypothetical protein
MYTTGQLGEEPPVLSNKLIFSKSMPPLRSHRSASAMLVEDGSTNAFSDFRSEIKIRVLTILENPRYINRRGQRRVMIMSPYEFGSNLQCHINIQPNTSTRGALNAPAAIVLEEL